MLFKGAYNIRLTGETKEGGLTKLSFWTLFNLSRSTTGEKKSLEWQGKGERF